MNQRSAILLSLAAFAAACGGAAAESTDTQTTPAPSTAPAPEADRHEQAGHHYSHAGPVGHRFQNADEWAERWERPERSDWQRPEEVIALMKISPGMAAADLGSGTGYFLPYLTAAVGTAGRVIALDIEPDMIRYLEERKEREGLTNLTVRRVASNNPGLAPAEVDRILIVNTWHHIPEREAFAAELLRALRPGGSVFVVDFTLETLRGPAPSHRIPPEQALEELRAGGFRADLAQEALPEQYVAVGHK